MSIRTDTNCSSCNHRDVCAILNKPNIITGEILEMLQTHMMGLDIIVSCVHYNKCISLRFPDITCWNDEPEPNDVVEENNERNLK